MIETEPNIELLADSQKTPKIDLDVGIDYI